MVVHKTSRFSFFFTILSGKKAGAGNSTGLFVYNPFNLFSSAFLARSVSESALIGFGATGGAVAFTLSLPIRFLIAVKQ
nr:MAG TPA: hypothetical protein [Ackermannviridae sp.]